MTDTIVIDRRFCGPPTSGHGGYSCGVIAARLGVAAEVTLWAPPPLHTPLTVERGGNEVRVFDGETLVAVAAPTARVALDLPEPIAPTDARAAAARSWILEQPEGHPYASCFVCGSSRSVGDGLRVFVGPVGGRPGLYAAEWVPDSSIADAGGVVRDEFVWSVLDCAGGIGALYDVDMAAKPSVLGRFAVDVRGSVRVGEPCVTAGWEISRDGRKRDAGSIVWRADGTVVGVGRAIWIQLR